MASSPCVKSSIHPSILKTHSLPFGEQLEQTQLDEGGAHPGLVADLLQEHNNTGTLTCTPRDSLQQKSVTLTLVLS